MAVRLRQIALVGQDIDWSVSVLTALFDTYVAYRDPNIVPHFGGLHNALLAFGDCFLEIVSPTDTGYETNSTSVKWMRKNGGDCGFLAIFQVDDIRQTSTRFRKLGRVALAGGVVVKAPPGEGYLGEHSFQYSIGDSLHKAPGTCTGINVQWHPKDFGTLVETEEQWPSERGAQGSWLPAGNRWQNVYKNRSSSVCQEFAGVEIAVPGDAAHVAGMAKKLAEGLGCPMTGSGNVVQLDGSTVRFVPVGLDGREGVVGVDLYATPGKPKAFNECLVHGIKWRLLDREGAESTEPLYATIKPRAKL